MYSLANNSSYCDPQFVPQKANSLNNEVNKTCYEMMVSFICKRMLLQSLCCPAARRNEAKTFPERPYPTWN